MLVKFSKSRGVTVLENDKVSVNAPLPGIKTDDWLKCADEINFLADKFKSASYSL